jgi:glycosyltransferase involved in cell wall biosynthesis
MEPTICLISSAQPSANPRLLKEAKALFYNGYKVNVIWCPISPWADNFDKQLFKNYQEINWVQAGYHAKYQPLGYWYARIRQKIWQLIYKLIGNHFDAAIKSLVLYSQELSVLALQHKADIFIGHNLGALPAILKASKRHKAKSIFDFEDYHRGESLVTSLQNQMVIDVENKYIPLISSATTASPAISNTYKKIFPDKLITTINNCFPVEYAIHTIKTIPQIPLKLFWFSQYIGKKRGLETVLEAISLLSEHKVSITLLGSCSSEMKTYFLSLASSFQLEPNQLVFMGSIDEKDIVGIVSTHHIGIVAEYGHIQNRNLCLTNKIFMYLLSGNALVLSDTSAHVEFINNHSEIGMTFKQENAEDLSNILTKYIDQPDLLNQHRIKSLKLGREKLNWDVEKSIFLSNIERVLE